MPGAALANQISIPPGWPLGELQFANVGLDSATPFSATPSAAGRRPRSSIQPRSSATAARSTQPLPQMPRAGRRQSRRHRMPSPSSEPDRSRPRRRIPCGSARLERRTRGRRSALDLIPAANAISPLVSESRSANGGRGPTRSAPGPASAGWLPDDPRGWSRQRNGRAAGASRPRNQRRDCVGCRDGSSALRRPGSGGSRAGGFRTGWRAGAGAIDRVSSRDGIRCHVIAAARRAASAARWRGGCGRARRSSISVGSRTRPG